MRLITTTQRVSPLVCWMALLAIQWVPGTLARGPHHPCSEVDKGRRKSVDGHLKAEHDHMQDDLAHSNIMPQKPVAEMSEEEKSFYYFKVHDIDNNGALDGLELIHAATHHTNDHYDDQNTADLVEFANQELDHIIEVIDDFIVHADKNQDGYLDFVEYTTAILDKDTNPTNDGLKEPENNQLDNQI